MDVPVGSIGKAHLTTELQRQIAKIETHQHSGGESKELNLDLILNALRTGWLLETDIWTYASASTFTVEGDKTSKFRKGARIKCVVNGTQLYLVCLGSSYSSGTTTVTVTGGTDYALSNYPINSKYISYDEAPDGYPGWFDYSPTYGGSGSMTWTSVTTARARFRVSGDICQFSLYASGITGGTASYALTISAPIDPIINAERAGCSVRDGNFMAGHWTTNPTTDNLEFMRYDTANFGLSSSRTVLANGFYTI